MLFICINDIDVDVSSSILIFADEAKLYSNVCTCDDADRLQCDLDKMSEWSTKWQMLFNHDNCKRLRVGHIYPSVIYGIGGAEIMNVEAEKIMV